MARVELLRVFVASPGELSEERSRLEEVVKELNATWGDKLRCRLELIKWETHSYPDVGRDTQSVIDQQIGDSYELFVGILWTRFGTPTAAYASGTEHEFRRAYERFRRDQNQLRIMFYFRESPVSPAELSPAELSKIQSFRKELGELGSLYWTYSTADEFADLARVHLSKHLQGWRNSWGLEKPVATEAVSLRPPLDAVPNEDFEPGYLDLMESVFDGFEEATHVLERISEALITLTERVGKRTGEMAEGGALDISSRVRYYKRVTNALAQDMDNFVQRVEVETPIFAKLYRAGTSSMARAASMAPEFGGDTAKHLSDGLEALKRVAVVLRGSREKMQSFRDTITTLPRATGRFIEARRLTVLAIDGLISEFGAALEHTENLERTMTSLLAAPPRNP